MDIKKFEKFEAEVMKALANEIPELSEKLARQYQNAKVKKREFTGAGFFTRFETKEDNSYKIRENPTFGNIHAEIEGLAYGMGFILFLKEGYINTLEGYTFEEAWYGDIHRYSLHEP